MLHLVYVALCKILTKQTPEPTGIIAFVSPLVNRKKPLQSSQ